MGWWTAVSQHRLVQAVPATPHVVREFYADLDNLRSLHPFLVDVRSLDRMPTADGYRQTYRVRERIPLGPLTVPIQFSATLWVPESGPVISESRQFPRVRLNSVMSFDAVEGGTDVVEELRIAAPRPLAAFTVREGVSAHIDMLAGIRRHFEEISRS